MSQGRRPLESLPRAAHDLTPTIIAVRNEIDRARRLPASRSGQDAHRGILFHSGFRAHSADRNCILRDMCPSLKPSRWPTGLSDGARPTRAFSACSPAACPNGQRRRFSVTAASLPDSDKNPTGSSRCGCRWISRFRTLGLRQRNRQRQIRLSPTASSTRTGSRDVPRRVRPTCASCSCLITGDEKSRHMACQRVDRYRQPRLSNRRGAGAGGVRHSGLCRCAVLTRDA